VVLVGGLPAVAMPGRGLRRGGSFAGSTAGRACLHPAWTAGPSAEVGLSAARIEPAALPWSRAG
jgi:hypothetical protein